MGTRSLRLKSIKWSPTSAGWRVLSVGLFSGMSLKKTRELNKAFFANLTDEEERKVWEEIRSKLESSDEIELLEYLKYAFPSLPLGDTTGLFWLITVIQPTTPFSSSTSRSFPAFPTT